MPAPGERGWLAALELVLPALADRFRPEVIVSQHGADAHAFDPLAHLRITTTAMGAAARLIDALAHTHAGGRWLSTGGGGYDVYRVVPRTWSHVWLAATHREVPAELPAAWRDRWADDAEQYGQSPIPTSFDDAPNAGLQRGRWTSGSTRARSPSPRSFWSECSSSCREADARPSSMAFEHPIEMPGSE